jgi:hypothetical protein
VVTGDTGVIPSERKEKPVPNTYRYLRGAAALLAATILAVLGASVPAHADTTVAPGPGLHRVTLAELRAAAATDAAAVQWIFIVNVNSGLTLAVAGSDDDNGAPIIQYDMRPGQNAQEQAWMWSLVGDYIVMRNAGTSTWKAAGISRSSTANNAKAIQWTYTPGLQDQQWIVGEYNDDTYRFKNRNSGKCLAIPSSSTTRGTQAIQWTCSNGLEQRWALYAWY